MRPQDPDDLNKIATGALRSMELSGYDYPIRKLRRSGDVCCVTLPLQVRGFLELRGGDWLTFGSTRWSGVVAFVKVTADQYECIAADGRKDFRKLARKVQGKKGGVRVSVPPAIREILSAKVGDFLMFGLGPRASMITIAAIKGGGDSAGSRRTG
ncbi:unnamed protein product [marine sediment metagenome]|uniref:Uncharacterized protein n=1 Tax=marine sediment metagenome TaxID=412755 RepID=X1QR29_9ZZZZ